MNRPSSAPPTGPAGAADAASVPSSPAALSSGADFAVQSLAQQRLALRPGLAFRYRRFGGRSTYVIEDPWSGHFYRVGVPEYTFLTALDGERSVAEVLAEVARRIPDEALDEADAALICRWALECGLAHTAATRSAARLDQVAGREARRRWVEWVNPLALRLSLGNPDPLLERAWKWLALLVAPAATGAGLGFIVVALVVLAVRWGEFTARVPEVLRPGAWAGGLFVFVLLKLWHELWHALVAKSHGGSVPDAGVIFFFGAPLAYVDLSTSYRLPDRWQRIHVALAGVYGEALAASAALGLWCVLTPGLVRDLAAQAILLAGVSSLAVNLNPLMRFDGYYVLSEWLDVPNLSSWGQQYVSGLARRWLWGQPTRFDPPAWGRVICVYGVAAAVWRWSVSLGLIVAAGTWFAGLGVLVSAAAVAWWWVWPAAGALRRAFVGSPSEPARPLRSGLGLAAAGGALALVLWAAPWPWPTRAPATVVYEPQTPIRAESAGFVARVLVADGQQVAAGQPLAELENDRLAFDVRLAECELAALELRRRNHLAGRETSALQALAEEARALAERVALLRHDQQRLVIRAPSAGRIVGRELERLAGRYLTRGTAVAALVDDDRKQLHALVSQFDQAQFQARTGSAVAASVVGVGPLAAPARLVRLTPEAQSRDVPTALTVAGGGALAVRRAATESPPRTPGANQPPPPLELESPHFLARVALPPETARGLAAGQNGWVGFHAGDESIASHLWRRAQGWFAW